jgi:hypothetical protein
MSLDGTSLKERMRGVTVLPVDDGLCFTGSSERVEDIGAELVEMRGQVRGWVECAFLVLP